MREQRCRQAASRAAQPEIRTASKATALESWKLLPTRPDWAKGFDWTPGEKSAHDALYDFLDDIADYNTARDLPGRDGTSRLSPHLHWGEISPRQVWHAVRTHGHSEGAQTFLKELGWREFCAQLLFHNPDLPTKPLDTRFDEIHMAAQRKGLSRLDARPDRHSHRGCRHAPAVADRLDAQPRAHDRGQLPDQASGHPLAARRRMVLGCLVDADLANNSANWQWVAGCGADAAPFFRIFNPVLQGEKFDPEGAYVRKFVPELADVPDRYIHKPWEMRRSRRPITPRRSWIWRRAATGP